MTKRNHANGSSNHVGAYYQQIIDGLSSGVIALDRNGMVLCANPSACTHLHTTQESLRPGARFEDLPLAGPLVDIVREIADTHEPVSRRELVLTLESGEKKEIGLSASLLKGPEAFNGVVFLFTDMTERRALERAAELNRQLASLGELTAGVVHELRNPLSVISGMAELLMRKLRDDPEMLRNAEMILEEVGELERSIGLFLGFARPFFDLQPAMCSPGDIAQRAAKLCRKRALDKKAVLRVSVDPDPPMMHADVARAAQALVNILNNAIDAVEADSGRVDLRVYSDRAFVVFEVIDNGPGLHLAPGEDLFAPFFTLKEGGTGLGLSIVHRIVTAHGGEISYANRPEGGLQFSMRLPIKPGARRSALPSK
ncbi:MAG TPA: ATP-binding protein [Candidatus Hydrogenedentes bacterium]|nr:ATP-binding protein [Candidatus Hydrogenedentota bacterium]